MVVKSDTSELKSRTRAGVLWTALNQFINYGLQFVVGIVIARMLTPSDYGITAIPAIFIAIATVFTEGGFSSALIRKKDVTEKDLSTAFYYSLIVGIICYTCMYIISPVVASFYDIPVLTPLMRITALSFLWGPLTTPQIVILKRNLNFKTIAELSIITKILGSIIGITLAYLGYGLWSLVAMQVVSSLLNCIITWIKVKWIPITRWSQESFKYLWNFGNKLMLIGLMDQLFQNISQAVIGKFYTTSQLGTFNRAHNFAYMPSQQLTGVIQNVSFPVLSKLQHDEKSLTLNYRRLLKHSAFVVFPMMMILAGVAEPLVLALLTDKWLGCVPYMRLICLWAMWYPIHSINLNLLQVKGRTDLSLRLEIIKKVILVIMIACTIPISIDAYLYGCILNSILVLVINTHYTGKLIGVGFLMQIMDIAPIILMSLLAGLVAFVASFITSDSLLNMFVGAFVGACTYIASAFLFKLPELYDLKYMLLKK